MIRLLPIALFAALLADVLAPTPAVAQQTDTEKVHRVIPLSPGGTLKLKTFSGDVRIRR